jgi:hypothetical protein
MLTKRVVTLSVGIFFSLTLAASSARADMVHCDQLLDGLKGAENMMIHLPDISRADEHSYLFVGAHSNNGKHLGFSAAAFRSGPKIGLVREPNTPSVTQNPEPATMILLGTGLAGAGAVIRRRRKLS